MKISAERVLPKPEPIEIVLRLDEDSSLTLLDIVGSVCGGSKGVWGRQRDLIFDALKKALNHKGFDIDRVDTSKPSTWLLPGPPCE